MTLSSDCDSIGCLVSGPSFHSQTCTTTEKESATLKHAYDWSSVRFPPPHALLVIFLWGIAFTITTAVVVVDPTASTSLGQMLRRVSLIAMSASAPIL